MFGRKALDDGYKGVAYLFTAFASSEQVHAANFGKVLAQLGAGAPPLPRYDGPVGTTRENLIAAAKGEAESIEDLYPKMLERIKPEGHQEAMRFVNIAWASERQGPLGQLFGGGWNTRGIVCFCPHCAAAMQRAGIDVERARAAYKAMAAFSTRRERAAARSTATS